ncbi:TDT family transporter [Actinoplanes sp. TRM 88003]|uniref:TDT family transporter n=1 Tax=Paractinoplanes aksuensis TaxID=2939490 RepID=A0ABT1E069_9ACTN|nr:TDT family transporter [Actinoplanes aksuensis]MCO8276420.1 TDT family transporter [Actinoplanes aksuensis]
MFGPNWFASVMGTGIVATAAATLPVQVPGQRAFATVMWLLAALILVAVLAATARRGTTHADDPVLVQFWGAPPMALMTVGAGTLLLGPGRFAITASFVLWAAGTVLGLIVAVAVPYRMMTRPGTTPDAAFGGWLMPVVPPMVSAATGALLVPHVPDGRDLLLACYALAGISLMASLVVITQIWTRLVNHQIGAARMVPTLWIVLGPLGQSVTAFHLLGRSASGVLPGPYAEGAQMLAVLYGVPVLGFALFWAALAASITIRTARSGLPFSLTWWSFTFPVGTVVTATGGLATRTGSPLLTVLAVILFIVLLTAWTVVATRTLRGVRQGTLWRVAPAAVTPQPVPATR